VHVHQRHGRRVHTRPGQGEPDERRLLRARRLGHLNFGAVVVGTRRDDVRVDAHGRPGDARDARDGPQPADVGGNQHHRDRALAPHKPVRRRVERQGPARGREHPVFGQRPQEERGDERVGGDD